MRVLLVKPSIGQEILGRYRLNDGPMEPLQLGILAALTPERHQVDLLDDRVETVAFDHPAELVGITVDTYTARRAYAIADGFRERGKKVVLGGIHATLLPDEAAGHADAVVLGDAEGVWSQVLDDCEAGRLKARYTSAPGVPQSGKFPRRDLFGGKRYLPISLVQFSRGCTLRCSYCSVARYFDRSHHCREPEEVVREIEQAGCRNVLFVDDNIVLNRARAKALFRALRPLRLHWASQAAIDMVLDEEMLDLMAESGCAGQLVGFESINPQSLQAMNKPVNARNFDRYQSAIATLRRHGFLTWASFILGNDFDTEQSIRETVAFAIESKFTLAFFHLLSPYPGTELYDALAREGRLLHDGRWWIHPDFRYNTAAFRPRHLEPERLAELTEWANREFYSVSSIARRALEPSTNLGSLLRFLLYLRFNTILRSTST